MPLVEFTLCCPSSLPLASPSRTSPLTLNIISRSASRRPGGQPVCKMAVGREGERRASRRGAERDVAVAELPGSTAQDLGEKPPRRVGRDRQAELRCIVAMPPAERDDADVPGDTPRAGASAPRLAR